MNALLKAAALAGLFASPVHAGRAAVGFIGLGIEMYNPPCAHACKDAISAPLNCTGDDMLMEAAGHHMKRMDGMDHGSEDEDDMEMGDGWMVMAPGPACKVHNAFYLQTLAYCISTRCPLSDLGLGRIETFWVRYMAGNEDGQPEPRQSYTTSLAAVEERPTRELNNTLHLNYTGVVTDEQYVPLYNANISFETVEGVHTRFGLAILLSCFLAPIALSLLRFLPWPAPLVSKVHAYLIDPPLFGTAHAAPLWGLGVVPTRGQALFLAYIWLINVVLSAVGCGSITEPHSWYPTLNRQVLAYVANRVGLLSFANLPLVYMFAGRNNILLWLTDWSHTTFLLLHRWIAFICMLQAVLHSVIYLHAYTVIDHKAHATEAAKPYWYWGIIGTVTLALLIPASVLPLRRHMYEVFLTSHVVLAMLALIGCFLHIYYEFQQQWGYETWVYIAVSAWVFDRVMRTARWARNGVRRALVTVVDGEYLRLDIPGVAARGHVYLYFPTLSGWRFWESHPFSVAGVTRLAGAGEARLERKGTTTVREKENDVIETKETQAAKTSTAKSSASVSSGNSTPNNHHTTGALATTLFIRRHDGFTSKLWTALTSTTGLPVFVESSYTSHGMTFLQADNPATPTAAFPNIIFVAGGVGITALLPYLEEVSGLGHPVGRRKLLWGVRTAPLVKAVRGTLGVEAVGAASGREHGVGRWRDLDVAVSVGERFDLRVELERELRAGQGGTTVVVCGPPGMADEVRCVVSGLGRSGIVVRLVVESYSW